ncbi:hypothetical protein ACFX5D_04730 [Flavobacterium sp. LB3P45]|uniref:CarboxypepD_reg-like domain-containing protein n=1 Tax=Flavobacterium fructosi TaxID=3230416 RepID=A0ABW6HK96_9FLAO
MIKIYFSILLLIFVFQSGFSQTEKLISGKVLHQNFPVEKVEVANYNSKKTTISNAAGEFSILVKVGDGLLFISKNHDIKKIVVDQNTIDKNNLLIPLILKPEQLEEVIITKMPSIKLSTDKGYEQGKLDKYTLEKSARSLKTGVYNGSIENGMDFMRIGRMIIGLFAKEKQKIKKSLPKIEFAALAKSSCDLTFYIETLKLKPEEIPLFLQFCDADPKSKKLIENHNILRMMDFLSTKNIEFKKR